MTMALERFLAKHVEMNHHARLVLFLRAQNVITELEAEEYLNPAALGGTSVLANPTNMQARHAVRAGLVAHGVIFGVMLLMIGMIHVAPLGATPVTPEKKAITQGKGFARFHAYPWATIVVDGKEVGTTPMETWPLDEGRHVVKFTHDWYEPVERTIDVPSSAIESAQLVAVDFCMSGTATKPLPEGACDKKPAKESK